jgi:GNAT superfamily N-acetyltransferase
MLVRPPGNDQEFEAYYAFRWRHLRAPWNQPPGSEKDEYEAEAIHLAAYDDAGRLIGVGRLHRIEGNRGQIRYMAVESERRGVGIGRALLDELEQRAIEEGMIELTLNAREDAVRFYRKAGYETVAPGHLLFGVISHEVMRKRLI